MSISVIVITLGIALVLQKIDASHVVGSIPPRFARRNAFMELRSVTGTLKIRRLSALYTDDTTCLIVRPDFPACYDVPSFLELFQESAGSHPV